VFMILADGTARMLRPLLVIGDPLLAADCVAKGR